MKLGRVALDGTKLAANASKHKVMSYDRIVAKIPLLQAEVAGLLAEAEQTDLDEDAEYGQDRRGDEIPADLARRQGRLAKLRAAKEQIEADAAEGRHGSAGQGHRRGPAGRGGRTGRRGGRSGSGAETESAAQLH